MKKKILTLIITAALLLTSAGCSSSGEAVITAGADVGTTTAEGTDITTTPAINCTDFVGDITGKEDSLTGGDASIKEHFGAEAEEGGDEEVFYEVEAADCVEEMPSGTAGGDVGYGGIPVAAGTLTAGEWNDNDHWSFWHKLFQLKSEWEQYRVAWSQQYMSRIRATVSSQGKPVLNASVTLSDNNGNALWQGKTDNTGVCWLFYSASGKAASITATVGGETKSLEVNDGVNDYSFEMSKENDAKLALDLMLVCDTTGSMGDELAYLQAELDSVIKGVRDDYGANLPIRLCVNFYRDDGDEYIVRSFPFTTDIDQSLRYLSEQECDGGGDMPEKVNAALDNAINQHQWEADSVKILFIVLDAPPHKEDSEAVSDMARLVKQAAEKGIRVIPVLSSGGDKETEYLMRDFAMKTGGTYLFLTDDSGVSAGGHIQPTTGDFTVEKLNELMMKIVGRYLEKHDSVPQYKDIEVEIKPEHTATEPSDTEPVDLPPIDIPVADGSITFYNDGRSYEVGGVIEFNCEYDEESGYLFPEIINDSETTISFGRWLTLSKVLTGGQEPVPYNPEACCTDDLIIVSPGESFVLETDLISMFGDIEDGEYVVGLTIYDDNGGGKTTITAPLAVGSDYYWDE